MESVRLRGHHLEMIREYDKAYRYTQPRTEDFNPRYGMDYIGKYIAICKKVLEGNVPVTIINSYDDICESCGCRANDGCLHEDSFEHEISTAQADAVIAKKYDMEIGKTYKGDEFLESLGVSTKDRMVQL